MKKTIILSENSFKKIKSLFLNEAFQNTQLKDFIDNYIGDIKTLEKITNLRNDRYKDYALEEAYNNWKSTGFNKNSEEYMIYNSNFKRFMFGRNGLLTHISYTCDRLTTKDGKPLKLDQIILDKDWVKSAFGSIDWRYSDLDKNTSSEEMQCFYTTILKIYQNPVIWNDLFFNPLFKEYYEKFLNIRKKLTKSFITDMEYYKRNYAKILPVKEYGALNAFAGAIKEVNKVLELIPNKQNAHPELFYDPNFGTHESSFVDDSDEF